jgi:preprotein translocase subunit SecA
MAVRVIEGSVLDMNESTQTKQMEKLKSICMNEINSHEGLKEELTDEKKLRYFITQMMMENILSEWKIILKADRLP